MNKPDDAPFAFPERPKKTPGNLIPYDRANRHYAYQDETCYPGAYFESHPPERGDKGEFDKYIGYELTIIKHTDKAFGITLKKRRKDIVEQRIANGFAVTADEYVLTLSFAEFVNRLFGPGDYDHYEEKEAYSESIRAEMLDLMRRAYNSK